ncbi:MAG TPA: beta-CASP ribonuclease aCPSF1, partial [Thermoprotei archaeon]|nr:beta-CASP ribonuclease aCPSF1 [Thermoprotei archaeon]
EIVKSIKKRVIIRADPSIRLSKEKAKDLILKNFSTELNITNIYFDDIAGEVELEVSNLNIPMRNNSRLIREIFKLTMWRPRIVHKPPLKSNTITQVRELFRASSEERMSFLRQVGQRIHRSIVFKEKGVRITALGGFQEVGRSAILIQTAESNVLLDAGIKPGARIDYFPRLDVGEFDIDNLDAVIISHAHLDHSGFLPFLYKYGYRGPVYTTEPTLYLMKLLFEDYIDVSMKEGKIFPYQKRDIMKAISYVIPLSYGEVTDITSDIRLTFHNAGHILGSAITHLHIGRGFFNLIYTGDFKFERSRLLDQAVYKFPRAELLIMESTYGGVNDIMPSRIESEQALIEIINRTISRGGKVLIPTLAVGRTQEIMLVLNEAIKRKLIPEITIFIEGMMKEATAIHTAFPTYLSQTIRESIHEGENPFMSKFFETVDDSSKREEVVNGPPSIILATSGMLTGGPVLEYLRYLAPDKRNSLVFVSYQIEGTLGRRILNGLRNIPFSDKDGRTNMVKMNMEVYRVEG